MKKILFLINTLNGGGAERVLIDVANALSEKGFDITVQTVINSGVFKDRLNTNVHYKTIVGTKSKSLRRFLAGVVSFVISPTLIHKLFIGNKYDYEVAFLEGVPTKIIGASKNEKSKKYTWVHIDLYNTFGLDKVHKNMQQHIECYKKFDKIVCVSENAKKMFTKRFGIKDNLIVKYNILDDNIIKSKAEENVEQRNRFRIVSVGRLENQKGYDRLLPVIKRLKDENIACELLLVGEGSQRDTLETYTKENNLSEIVEFIGFTNNPYKYMQSADLLVFPSRAEGYSTVVTEAIILGKPIVVTDCAGMKEILGNSEYGIVAENNDEELYKAIKNMVCNDEVRQSYSEKALQRGKDFTKEKRFKELIELFE